MKAVLDEWYLGRSPRGLSGAGFYPLFLKQTSVGGKKKQTEEKDSHFSL